MALGSVGDGNLAQMVLRLINSSSISIDSAQMNSRQVATRASTENAIEGKGQAIDTKQ